MAFIILGDYLDELTFIKPLIGKKKYDKKI